MWFTFNEYGNCIDDGFVADTFEEFLQQQNLDDYSAGKYIAVNFDTKEARFFELKIQFNVSE